MACGGRVMARTHGRIDQGAAAASTAHAFNQHGETLARFDIVDASSATTGEQHTGEPGARTWTTVSRSMVRPYARTGGRTRPDRHLAVEALVSTSGRGRQYDAGAPDAHRDICDLCVQPCSVAEIAGRLGLPLGVIKVLVGDMADAGLVLVHQPGHPFGDRSSREFLERVLAGLRAL